MIDSLQRGGKSVDEKHQAMLASLYDSAFALGKPTGLDFYNAACANSTSGNLKKSIKYLKHAFENGYRNFDWMYYDRDLTAIRYDQDYLDFEKQYRPDSVVFLFDILRKLNASNEVWICDTRISIPEGVINYSLDDIMYRVGVNLKVTNDSLIDFSNKVLSICRSKFNNTDDSFNSLQRMSLRELAVDACSGNLVVEQMRMKYLGLYDNRGVNDLRKITMDRVTLDGMIRLYVRGSEFVCKNSTFNIDVPAGDEFRWGLAWSINYDDVTIKNTTFGSTQKNGVLNPFDFDFENPKNLIITGNKFNHTTRLLGSVENRLVIRDNSFPPYLEIAGLKLPDFDYHFPFSQLHNSRLVIFDYTRVPYIINGDSIADYADDVTYGNFTALYKRLYDEYRNRADIASANEVYVIMKDLEITHLRSLPHRTTEETIRLRLNQLMGFYTNHATSPGKALIISFYIILAFGIFYCFFPSDWDKTSKAQVVADYRMFIEKNEHGYVKPFFKMMRGLSMSLLNAFALSLNAFITLGFGNIPTTGVARYVCVLQGALGWFLLSLFTVALLNQVLL
jgi:hypothetical protein